MFPSWKLLTFVWIWCIVVIWPPPPPPDIPEAVFVELMKFATTSVKFRINNIMYRQVDGISMGSVLGPTMAGIFVGFHEVDLFSKYMVPDVYFHYVDNTFCIFDNETEACKFFSHLNKMYPSLRFTLEKESNSTLPFLDVVVYKEASCFLMSVYYKPTFTGLYIHWDSFCPKKHKLNLIKTLVHRALMTCSESKLGCEVSFITEILCNNGFPEDIVRSVIRDKIAHFHKIKVASVLFISGYLGWVISVIILLIRFLLSYESVTFLPIYVLFFAHILFCHLVGKMPPSPT